MKSVLWFVFGFSLMVVVSLLVSACWLNPDFTVGIEPPSPPSSSSMPATIPSSSREDLARRTSPLQIQRFEGTTPYVLGVAGSHVPVVSYAVWNDDLAATSVSTFTVRVSDPSIVQSVGYAWDDEVPHGFIAPTAEGFVSFNAEDVTVPAEEARGLNLFIELRDMTSDVMFVTGARVNLTLVALSDTRARAATLSGMLRSSEIVARKSVPVLTGKPLSDASLGFGRRDIFMWSVSADVAGPIAVKQFAVRLNVSNATLCEFQLRRGTRLMAADAYTILDARPATDAAADLKAEKGCVKADTEILIWLRAEEQIPAAKDLPFTLRANVVESNPSASVIASFAVKDLIATSNLWCASGAPARLADDPSSLPAILWSDLSGKAHSDVPCASSRDWIGDALLSDLDAFQRLGL